MTVAALGKRGRASEEAEIASGARSQRQQPKRVDLSSRDWGIVSAALESAIGRERRFISDVTRTYNSSALKLKMECHLARMVRVANSVRNQRRSLAQGRGLATAGSKEKDGGTAR